MPAPLPWHVSPYAAVSSYCCRPILLYIVNKTPPPTGQKTTRMFALSFLLLPPFASWSIERQEHQPPRTTTEVTTYNTHMIPNIATKSTSCEDHIQQPDHPADPEIFHLGEDGHCYSTGCVSSGRERPNSSSPGVACMCLRVSPSLAAPKKRDSFLAA